MANIIAEDFSTLHRRQNNGTCGTKKNVAYKTADPESQLLISMQKTSPAEGIAS